MFFSQFYQILLFLLIFYLFLLDSLIDSEIIFYVWIARIFDFLLKNVSSIKVWCYNHYSEVSHYWRHYWHRNIFYIWLILRVIWHIFVSSCQVQRIQLHQVSRQMSRRHQVEVSVIKLIYLSEDSRPSELIHSVQIFLFQTSICLMACTLLVSFCPDINSQLHPLFAKSCAVAGFRPHRWKASVHQTLLSKLPTTS